MTDRTALFSLLTATVLQALDLTIAAIALPPIEAAMGVGTEAGTWVLTSYIVAMALTTPLAGVLSTRVGRRDSLLAAIGGLTVASCICALATDLAALLAARIAQGAAAGLIMPLVQATLLDTSKPADHGK